jgi:hypothetical protein
MGDRFVITSLQVLVCMTAIAGFREIVLMKLLTRPFISDQVAERRESKNDNQVAGYEFIEGLAIYFLIIH